MTGIKIDIEPKDIEQAITQAVFDSSLGETIAKVVKSEIEGLCERWKATPLRKAIEHEVKGIAVRVITDEYEELIKNAVREHLTDETVKRIVSQAVLALYE